MDKLSVLSVGIALGVTSALISMPRTKQYFAPR